MKKLILILVCAITAIAVNAQHLYRAGEFAYATKSYNRWVWTDWYYSSIEITVGNGQIYINSDSPQLYTIVGNERVYKDDEGGQNTSWQVVDQDYDRGTLRIRLQHNGIIQMYIEFSNVRWVYSSIKQIY